MKHTLWELFFSSRPNRLMLGVSVAVGLIMLTIAVMNYWGLRGSTQKQAKQVESPPAATTTSVALVELTAERINAWREAPRSLAQATRLRLSRRDADAEKLLKDALGNAPDYVALNVELGKLLVDQERWQEALEPLMRALDGQPADVEVRLMLAQALNELGHTERALEIAQWILDDDPYSLTAMRIAAEALTRTGQHRSALNHWRKLAQLDPYNLDAQCRFAEASALAGDSRRAIETLQDVLRTDPAYSPAHRQLAIVYLRQGRTNDALEVLKQARTTLGSEIVNAWLATDELAPLSSAVSP